MSPDMKRLIAAAERLNDEQVPFTEKQREAVVFRNSLYGLRPALLRRLSQILGEIDAA